jgi:hypothetical protein
MFLHHPSGDHVDRLSSSFHVAFIVIELPPGDWVAIIS